MATPTAADTPPSARLLTEDSVIVPVTNRSEAASPGRRDASTGEMQPRTNHRQPLSESITVGDRSAGLHERFYAYGIGLLRQGDLPRAQRAMRQVQALAPRSPDGYYGLGRVYLTEGDLLAAKAQSEKARSLAPSDPRPHALLAMTDRRMGQYDAALPELTRLARAYPRDRVLWFEIGMCHFLTGQYEEGARAFEKVLEIDPDDLAAHYNLMRCLRRLRRVPEARREEVIYQNLREDVDAKKVSLGFLQQHPWADRETRTIHEHPLYPVASERP
jgi:tetratricopeptide (TPR) repeat protein